MAEGTRTGIGERVRELRQRRTYSIRELSEKSGVSPDAIVKLEHEYRRPRPGTVRKVAKALGVSAEYLTTGKEGTRVVASSPPVEKALSGEEYPYEELEALARRRAEREGVSVDEALGRIYREHALIGRHRPRKPIGAPRGEAPVMGRPDAAASAVSAARGD